MTDAALYRLLAWSSPGYPTGAFSYSHGLEWAVEAGTVTAVADLQDYVEAAVRRGGGWVDAVLFAHVWRTAQRRTAAVDDAGRCGELSQLQALQELVELACAFRGSAETAWESCQQGAAFLQVTRRAWPHPLLEAFARHCAAAPVAHCAAVALSCAAHDLPLEASLHAYLQAFATNLISAGARLIPLGQTDAQIAIARLAPCIASVCEAAPRTELDDLGTATMTLELGSCWHETQYTRLFRS